MLKIAIMKMNWDPENEVNVNEKDENEGSITTT